MKTDGFRAFAGWLGGTRAWGTPEKELAMYLHMMRGLREKIHQGSQQ